MSKKPEPMKPPSQEFREAFLRGSGGLVVTCELCQRTYFGDDGDYEEGEREDLEAKARNDADKYIPVEGYCTHGYLDGRTIVYDCPCLGEKRVRCYEEFILNHTRQIIDYLERLAKESEAAAKESREYADRIKKAQDRIDAVRTP